MKKGGKNEDDVTLTRIEDMGEFLHELQNDEQPRDEASDDPFASSETAFDTSDFTSSTTEETPAFNAEGTEEAFSLPADESMFSMGGSEDLSSLVDETFSEKTQVTPTPTKTFVAPETTAVDFDLETPLVPETPVTEDYVPSTPAVKESSYTAPENFADLRKFAESTSFTGMAVEGNPSFSVLLKNVKYLEDASDIIILLKEFGLMTDSEEQLRARLSRGQLLIPRISEFSAIMLAHKLRRFDLEIQLGLSEEIFPSKNAADAEVGLVSKLSLQQNQSHHFDFSGAKLSAAQIIVSATSTLDGYQVVKYMGVASEHQMIEGHVVEDETSSEIPELYRKLAEKLKYHALKANSNAVVGLNYQLTPLPSDNDFTHHKYRLTCTGNLVWINKL